MKKPIARTRDIVPDEAIGFSLKLCQRAFYERAEIQSSAASRMSFYLPLLDIDFRRRYKPSDERFLAPSYLAGRGRRTVTVGVIDL